MNYKEARKKYWGCISVEHRFFYKELALKLGYKIYGDRFWYFVMTANTSILKWYEEFNKPLPKKLAMVWY